MSRESTKATSIGACSYMLTMVREQALRSAAAAAAFPTRGNKVLLQFGSQAVHEPASEKRSENKKAAVVS